MVGASWNFGRQRGGSYFSDLYEFDGGFLPRWSAARLAAMNFARLALMYQSYFTGEELISYMTDQPRNEEVKAICHTWPTGDRLLVLEIMGAPAFAEHIKERLRSRSKRDISWAASTVEAWLEDMECQPKASAAILDNGYNMVSCLKVRTPNGHKYLVYDPQATGSGPTKYAMSISTIDIAEYMSRTISDTPTPGAHRRDFAYFIEMQLREERPRYARASSGQYSGRPSSSRAGPSSAMSVLPPFIPPETMEDIAFQDALSRALKLSLRDRGRTNANDSAAPSTASRARKNHLDRARRSTFDVIHENRSAEKYNASRSSRPDRHNGPGDVESSANLECGISIDEELVRRLGLRQKYIRIFESLQRAAPYRGDPRARPPPAPRGIPREFTGPTLVRVSRPAPFGVPFPPAPPGYPFVPPPYGNPQHYPYVHYRYY
ncbi:hypothetical protein C0995_014594 [Termitomyces sp. Mi166|nr:hypothetical protein C0995_014594 [Termitomyces sp. Mi166\